MGSDAEKILAPVPLPGRRNQTPVLAPLVNAILAAWPSRTRRGHNAVRALPGPPRARSGLGGGGGGDGGVDLGFAGGELGGVLALDPLGDVLVVAHQGLQVGPCGVEDAEVRVGALLFSRIVPCVKDIGLWGEKVRGAFADLGVLDAADSDLEALMRDDEDIAERVEREHAAEFASRKAEVDAAIAGGEG